MFKQFAIAMLAMVASTSAKKLKCETDDGTCMQVSREHAEGQCLPIFAGEYAVLQLSDNQINKSKKAKKGKKGKGKCYWRLMVPCPENEENLIPLEEEDSEGEDSFDFEDYGAKVSVLNRKKNMFKIEVYDEMAMAGSHELTFINSCNVNKDGTIKEADGDEEEDGSMYLSLNVDILNFDDEENDGNDEEEDED